MRAVLQHVSKRYQDQIVFTDLNLILEGTTVLMAPSGYGKTTLSRLLLGLEQPDSGTVSVDGRLVAVFQEDRLCNQLTAVQNITLVSTAIDKKQAQDALLFLGFTQADFQKPVRQLSGGQARRVALVRALLAPADGVLLDEPFKGLDQETRRKAMEWTKKQIGNRWSLLITHSAQEAQAFGGKQLKW